MNSNEIDERIAFVKANYGLSDAEVDLLNICQLLNAKVVELEARLRQTSNTADCLANGIQPD